MIMKIFTIVAVMIFGAAGLANAQGYDAEKRDPMTEQQRRESSEQGTGSSNTSGYGTSGSQRDDGARRSSSSQYGGSYQGGVNVDLYDQDQVNGTGPRIKGRY
jgi:opacity protein-like surface antigen